MNKDKVIETAEPIKTPYSKVIYRKKPPAPVNEDGLRLTKSGKVDKRQATSKKNLEKSENYQKIQNTIEKVKQQSYEDVEESDDEDEFENSDVDKFVHLERSYKMLCTFNNKFKKWTPVKITE